VWPRSTSASRLKFLTVVRNLQTGEAFVVSGRDRKHENAPMSFSEPNECHPADSASRGVVDMWRDRSPTASRHWAPKCRIVYDKLTFCKHANKAIDEVRGRQNFSVAPQGGVWRGGVKGKARLCSRAGFEAATAKNASS